MARTEIKKSTLRDFNAMIGRENTKNYLASVLGSKKEQFVNNIVALVSNSKSLQECEPLSVMYSGIKATALELPLDPNLGFAYVIPFNNNKEQKKEAQFQIGYKGFIQLAIRSGQYRTINVTDIREGEIDGEDILTGEIKFKKVDDRLSKNVVGYAAYFKLLNGFEKTLYMSKEDVEAHAKRYSQTFSSDKDYIRNASKWSTDFDAMAKKTVIKLLLSKWAPLSVQMTEAYKSDQAIIKENGYDYADNATADEVLEEQKEEHANTEEVEMDIPDAVVMEDNNVTEEPDF